MFKAGDTIICIEDNCIWHGSLFSSLTPMHTTAEKGKIYTVRCPHDFCTCGQRILLEEIQVDTTSLPQDLPIRCGGCKRIFSPSSVVKGEVGYFACNFRKLTSIGELEGKEFSVPLPAPAEKKTIMTPKPQVEFSK